jgi:transposase
MKERKQYTQEFKQGAVRLVTQQGRKHAEVAKSLGISEWSVSRWVRAASSEGRKPFAGKDNAPHLNKRSSSYDAESKNSKRSARF